MTDIQQAMTDGPNTHKYPDYRASSVTVINVTDVAGVVHHFHVPTELYVAILADRPGQYEAELDKPDHKPGEYDSLKRLPDQHPGVVMSDLPEPR